ncbi:hypothetical protein [Caulobacter sp.]|uniref:hypothetical protein n=1 Tax=Caulobacter sp. TaxID=78 RepID=UPI003BB0452B
MGAARNFRQQDVTRAIRAAKAAGLRPHVWIGRDGVIHITEADDQGLTAPPADALPDDSAEQLCDDAF